MAIGVASVTQASIRPAPQHGSVRILLRSRPALVGALVLFLWLLVMLTAGLIAGDPLAQNAATRLGAPSWQHPFGTDELGRDVLSRVLHGSRVSLPVGVVVIAFSAVLGSAVGAVAGFAGGLVDDLAMRTVDILLAFPSIVLAMAIAAVLGPSLVNAVIAVTAVWWPEYARVMRGQVLATKGFEYVVAARALGASDRRLLLRHVLPNCVAPILVKSSLDVGSAVVYIATLSFIGLGAVPPTPEWGAMIAAGRVKFFDWWLSAFPGLAILSVALGFNFLGDGLRDALDPRTRRR